MVDQTSPSAIASNVADILLDVDAHKLANPVTAAQLAEGLGKANRLAMHPQDGTIQHHQSCTSAHQSKHLWHACILAAAAAAAQQGNLECSLFRATLLNDNKSAPDNKD